MKKLTLKETSLESGEALSRNQLRGILAGSGSGGSGSKGSGSTSSGSGSYGWGSGLWGSGLMGSGSGSNGGGGDDGPNPPVGGGGSGSGSAPCVPNSPYPKVYACQCKSQGARCYWTDAQGRPQEGWCRGYGWDDIHCSDLI
jgi:hypothetical protein